MRALPIAIGAVALGTLAAGTLMAGGALAAETSAAGRDAALYYDGPAFRPWLAVLPIALPLLGAALTLALRSAPVWQERVAVLTLCASTLFAAVLAVAVTTGGPLMMAGGNWVPPFSIVVAVDALGALLVLVTSLVGLAALPFASGSVEEEGVSFGFYTFYLLLIAGVCGAFSTGDIFNLYVWFEVFLVSSFGLIVHGGTPRQFDGAVKYGVLNLIATTIFLVTVGALYGVTGTLNMADIHGVLATIEDAPTVTIGALFVMAFAMKAAAFPLHIWLPASYHTPRVVVAALFGGLLTKVGVYSLMRVMVMLFGERGAPFLTLIAWVGVVTAIVGALGALAQDSLKRVAAFLVISGVGVMLIGIGLGTEASLSGAIVYTVHSILVMTALFLVFGLAEALSGSDSLARSTGLYAGRGLAAGLFLVFALSAAGLPPFSGFWPKLMLVEASLDTEGALSIAGAIGIIVSGFLTTIVAGRVWALTFLKPAPAVPQETDGTGTIAARMDTALLSTSVVIFAAMVVGIGLMPDIVVNPASEAAASLLDPSAYIRAVLEGE